jgi:hypothetical protein
MIRIEGIPIVAARLEAASKSAGVSETARPVRQPRMHLLSTPSKTARLAGRGRIRGLQHKEGA